MLYGDIPDFDLIMHKQKQLKPKVNIIENNKCEKSETIDDVVLTSSIVGVSNGQKA